MLKITGMGYRYNSAVFMFVSPAIMPRKYKLYYVGHYNGEYFKINCTKSSCKLFFSMMVNIGLQSSY